MSDLGLLLAGLAAQGTREHLEGAIEPPARGSQEPPAPQRLEPFRLAGRRPVWPFGPRTA